MAPPPQQSAGAAQATSRPKGDSLVTAFYSAADTSRVDVKLDGQRTGHLAAAGGLTCLVRTGGEAAGGVRVFNPATGVVTDIPAGRAAEAGGNNKTSSAAACVFGQIPATGQYKVLRIITARGGGHGEPKQSCEILTLHASGQRWRPAQGPPAAVDTTIPRQRAVAQGFAHFLTTSPGMMGEYDGIASFDLAKEAWRPSLLRGPLASKSRNRHHFDLSLAELNGRLVFVHHDYLSCCIDMWMLTDLEKGSWLRIQSLPLGSILRGSGEPAEGQGQPAPLMVLDDGRIAFWVRIPDGSVKVYDPKAVRRQRRPRVQDLDNGYSKFHVAQKFF
jgi:F-box interacting protein